MSDEIKKLCKECDVEKPLGEFYESKFTKDGREGKCKVCRDAQNNRWARDNAEKRRKTKAKATKKFRENNPSYMSEWVKTNRNKVYASQEKYNKKCPEKYHARVAVRLAVKYKKLPHIKTLKCVECGRPAQEYHHHKGYAKENWLDVIPVCRICHKKFS